MPKGEKMRKLTSGDIEEIVNLYTTPNLDETWTGSASIARRFGVRPSVILYHLRRSGTPIRGPKERFAHGKQCKPITRIPQGTPPPCKCGCGEPVQWSRTQNKWLLYAPGHYRPRKLYHDRSWLLSEYVKKHRTLPDIAAEFGVCHSTIAKAVVKAGIPLRSQAESLRLSGASRGANNPAWKGGIAKWAYSPNWKSVARKIRKRDNYTCKICGKRFAKSSKLLHVRHIDGDKWNNHSSNLVCVCASCHPFGPSQETREYWESITKYDD